MASPAARSPAARSASLSGLSSGMSALSLSDNLGHASGVDTPGTCYTDVFPEEDEARLGTPHTEECESELDDVEDGLVDEESEFLHISHASQSDDGTSQQGSQFRARPAPPTTFIEGVGPRLTKAAALRQGLEWDDPRDNRRAMGEEAYLPVDFDNVPGHKRSGLALNVASLAEPSVAPRQNRAALLRAGIILEEPAVRNVAEMAARNRARDLAEREMRRKSVAPPQSLSNPEVLPRQNRAALLRLGQVPAPQGRDPRLVAEQAILNKEKEAAERLAKRKSVALPSSLAAPTITPRANRASKLRTGDLTATPRTTLTPRPSTMFVVSETTPRASQALAPARTTAERFQVDKDAKVPRRSSMAPLRSLAAPVIAPRGNRASKLREKIPTPTPLPTSGLSSRRSSSSSLTSMSTGTSKLNPSPVKAKFPMPSPKSRFTAPRPAPLPPNHRPASSVSSEISAAVDAVSDTRPNAPERRNSIFRRLNPRASTSSSGSEPRPTRSSILREGLGAKIGKTRAT